MQGSQFEESQTKQVAKDYPNGFNKGPLADAIQGVNAEAQATLAQPGKGTPAAVRTRRPAHTLSRAVGLVDRALAHLPPQQRLEVLRIIEKDALAAAQALSSAKT